MSMKVKLLISNNTSGFISWLVSLKLSIYRLISHVQVNALDRAYKQSHY
jgi:hypothetical protein